MRKTLIALAATTGLLTLGSIGASAAPLAPLHDPAQAVAVGGSTIQQAAWGCGPHCRYWHHRRWVESHRWHHYDYHRYGYNGGHYHYYR